MGTQLVLIPTKTIPKPYQNHTKTIPKPYQNPRKIKRFQNREYNIKNLLIGKVIQMRLNLFSIVLLSTTCMFDSVQTINLGAKCGDDHQMEAQNDAESDQGIYHVPLGCDG